MKKVIIGSLLAISFTVEMFVGATQLGLFYSQNAKMVSFIFALIFGSIFIFGMATWVSDMLVLKIFKHDTRGGNRWFYYSAGHNHLSPGVGLRLIAYALSQAFPIYFATLFIFK